MNEKFKNLFVDGRKHPFGYLKKHPVILTALIILALSAVTFCEQNYISESSIFFAFALLSVASFGVSLIAACCGLKRWYSVILFFFLLISSYLFLYYLRQAPRKAGYIYIVAIAALAVVFIVLLLTKQLTVERVIILLFLAGVMLRFTYVLYTSPSTRQHDVYKFGDSGHSGYIRYLYENGHLPDFDVTEKDQFYHPPLHHIIAAVWWNILSAFGVADKYAQSSIQTLTLFYSSVSLIISYKLLKEFKIHGAALIAVFAVLAFHPTFVIFSASINNDILSVTFMLLAVLYSVKWYRSRSFKDIMIIAAAVGLGMMTKLSAYMVAFGIAFLFLFAFIKDIKNFKKYLIQFAAFAVLCVPLALWWEIRNAILYDVPIAYVQRLSNTSWQYVGDVPVLTRLFDFSKLFNAPVFDQWTNRGDKLYNEYNPMISLLKTSVFGEYINDFGAFSAITAAAGTLFWSNLIIAFLSVVALGYTIFSAIRFKAFKNGTVDIGYASIIITGALMLIFYYVFCFTYPHHCTENIRYVSPLIVLGCVFIGRTLCDVKDGLLCGEPPIPDKEPKRTNKAVTIPLYVATICLITVFCVSSSTMFLQMAIA
ncbi:MAG: glycosyltransferase family 39 protein [Clostridia bacterium]|nr:glycosyltransferase family 39 protein [Clostridia bacterium]